MNTNILYLTKNCNLNCSYCFERGKHINESVSIFGIDSFIHDLCAREPSGISTICFFGGEPFLEFDKLFYTISLCKKIKKETGKGFAFSAITNGTLLHKYINELREIIFNSTMRFSLNISYDESFQSHRTSNDIVERNLSLLLNKKIPFGISYTVLNYNCDPKILSRDLILIIKKYFKNNNHNDIIRLNFDMKKIEEYFKCPFDEYLKKLKEYLFLIFLKYKIPICHLVCSLCGRCNHSEFGDAFAVLSNGKDISIIPEKNNNEFNLF